MSRIIQLFAVCALLAGLSACSKDDAPKTKVRTKPVATASPSVADKPATSSKPVAKKEVTYRPINARLRDNDERIVIMVPDDVDIESGRMLEYRQNDEGAYYLKSVIPQ